MPKETIISQSFSTIIKPLTILGLYPPDKPTAFSTVRTYFMYIFLMALSVTLLLLKLIIDKTGNLNYSYTYLSEVTFSAVKFFFYILKRNRIKKCINYFGDERFVPRRQQGKRMVEDCVKICRKICMVYFYGVIMIGVFLWLLPAWISKKKKFPIDIWVPFDRNANKVYFYLVFCYLSIASTYSGLCGTVTDPVIGSLVFHATTQLRILKNDLQNLDDYQNETQKRVDFENVEARLKYCVQRHNDIFDFIDEFEDCFSWFVFCQIAGSILALGFSTIGFTQASPMSMDGLRFSLFYLGITFQLFFYFYFGTMLYEENNSFMNAIVESSWYKYDTTVRKFLLIMMQRSRKPLSITAGKIVNLTLENFTTIMKTSYSLIAVLKNF